MSSFRSTYRWWLSPDLEIFPLSGTHLNFANDYLSWNRIPFNRQEQSQKLMTLGWIRLILIGSESSTPAGDEGLSLSYEYDKHKSPSSKAIKVIKDFAIEQGVKSIYDDVTGRGNNLMESTNKLNKLPKQFGEGNMDAKKFWMAPDGTFYGVKYEWSHPRWVSELYKFLKYPPHDDGGDELYKKGWIRILTGFEGQTYTLWYEHRHVPISARLKHKIRDLAIELRVMKMKDRYGNDEEFLPENRTISKSILKELIKKILKEVSQKDLKQRHPNNPAFFDKNRSGMSGFGGWDVDKLTLDNLMALKRKTRDMIAALQKHPNEKNNEWLKYELEQYKMISLEIQNRIDYINKPIKENQTPELKSKFFTVKFGEKELPKDAGKIFYREVWFANAVKVNADWDEKHANQWVINRHVGAFQMGLPSITEYFKDVKALLNYLDRWLQKSGNLKEDLQQRHNQVGSQSQCTGMSHGVSSDYNDVQLVRDPINDPMLNGKLHENEYKFDEFKWLSRMDGFGTPIDVRRGTILLGVIVSQPDGYIISTILGPQGSRSYRQDPKKPFKTKEDAAKALDVAWRILRSSETNSV